MKSLSIANFLKQPKENSELVFLRGFQRSGTNWLCRLMNLHPHITCTGEFHFESFFKSFNHILNRRFNYFNTDERRELINSSFCEFLESIVFQECDHNRVCIDRTPCSLTDTYLPNYKYLLITRDGRDCIVSWFYHCLAKEIHINENMSKKISIFKENKNYFETNKRELLNLPNYLRNISRSWNDRIMSDLTLRSENNVYWISYEDLITQTEQIRADIYSFLNLDPSLAKILTAATTPGFKRHDPTHHNRKGTAGRWREYFTQEHHDIFLSEASEALQLLGYSTDY